jgi:diaminopimelate epimerase
VPGEEDDMLEVAKAHAYGNDFLFVHEEEVDDDVVDLSMRLCERHTGIGADGLIVYRPTRHGAAMRLHNADGSRAEVSGNGVRCLAAMIARARLQAVPGRTSLEPIVIETEAGEKRLSLVEASGDRFTFRASMGVPGDVRQLQLEVAGERINAVALSVGNPQCVVLGSPVNEGRLHRLGPALEQHPMFPARTNVEFVEVLAPDRLRILIWERGVGPTLSSGTGSCASAVAAAAYGGAERDVEVIAPGGTQRVEWCDDGLYLTGWAETLFTAQWPG